MIKNIILTTDTTKIPTQQTIQGINGKKTTLDHIYVTNPDKIKSTTDNTTTSDHSMLEVVRYIKQIPQQTIYRMYRNFKETYIEKLKKNNTKSSQAPKNTCRNRS